MQADHYLDSHRVVVRHGEREVELAELQYAVKHEHDTVDSLPDLSGCVASNHECGDK